MTGMGAFTKGLSEVTALLDGGKYDRALARLEQVRKAWPGNARLSLLWARLVQLQDDPTHTLADARRAIQQAVELDADAPAGHIEFGYFLDNVEDDPRAATKVFAQGITSARNLLIEGLLGQARALLQLDKRDGAVRCLVEAHRLADAERTPMTEAFADRIDELLAEIGQTQSA